MDQATSILFANDPKIVEVIKTEILYSGGKEQDVILVNEKKIMSKHERKLPMSYDIQRPLTSVIGYN